MKNLAAVELRGIYLAINKTDDGTWHLEVRTRSMRALFPIEEEDARMLGGILTTIGPGGHGQDEAIPWGAGR